MRSESTPEGAAGAGTCARGGLAFSCTFATIALAGGDGRLSMLLLRWRRAAVVFSVLLLGDFFFVFFFFLLLLPVLLRLLAKSCEVGLFSSDAATTAANVSASSTSFSVMAARRSVMYLCIVCVRKGVSV